MVPQLSKVKSKYIRSLRRRKIRQNERHFIVEGSKMAFELLHNLGNSVYLVVIAESFDLTDQWNRLFPKDLLRICSDKEFSELTELTSPAGILVVTAFPKRQVDRPSSDRIVYLDGIQDPGNLGTILRTVAWFGDMQVIIGPGCVDPYNTKCVQSSMGAILQVPFFALNLDEVLNICPNHKVLGLTMDGSSIERFTWPKQSILVLGSEGKGIKPEIMEQLDEHLHILGNKKKTMESLNAGIALGIALASWNKNQD